MGFTYKDAGVDTEASKEALERVSGLIRSTHDSRVLSDLEQFGGLFGLDDYPDAEGTVLVAGADGVGTKLKVAFRAQKHDTVGIDLVAMCVNDILAQGAEPLFFLDYLACTEIDDDMLEEIFSGMVRGCRQAGCALLGGETAQMPGFYDRGEYELAGFALGRVRRKDILPRKNISSDLRLVGLASSGLHSNGFSLVRRLIFQEHGYGIDDYIPGLESTLAEELLTPTRIYVRPVLKLLNEFDYDIAALAHITGGGLPENIARILPRDRKAVIYEDSWPKQNIFKFVQELGDVSSQEMFKTFNMGIGLVMALPAEEADRAVDTLQELGVEARVIGDLKAGQGEVEIV